MGEEGAAAVMRGLEEVGLLVLRVNVEEMAEKARPRSDSPP
jgi:hypothetical protein